MLKLKAKLQTVHMAEQRSPAKILRIAVDTCARLCAASFAHQFNRQRRTPHEHNADAYGQRGERCSKGTEVCNVVWFGL